MGIGGPESCFTPLWFVEQLTALNQDKAVMDDVCQEAMNRAQANSHEDLVMNMMDTATMKLLHKKLRVRLALTMRS